MIEGTGGGGSVKTLETMGFTYVPEVPGWDLMVDNLSLVPVVALGLGPVAGLGAGRLVMSHYSLLVKGLSQLFVAGPPVVAAVGEKRTKEELGGSHIHAKNGAIDDEAASEAEAFAMARTFLSYLPSSIHELPERKPTRDKPDRREQFPDRGGPARFAAPLQDPSDHRSRRGSREFLRDWSAARPVHCHRLCADRRISGRDHGERPDGSGWPVDSGNRPQGGTLH
jgi:hypothetical protein